MDTINTVKVKDSLEGFKFSSEEAHRHLAFMFNRITDSQDELRDLAYYLKHDRYSNALFKKDDFLPFIEKMDDLIQQIETLYEDSANIFKTKELLVKEEEEQ